MKKILVGEDSNVVKNITQKILQSQNYVVKSGRNGKEVYDALLREHFDVLLLDISMPVMDGMECAKKIRKEAPQGRKDIPILAVTGNNENYNEETFKDHGITDFVAKPINYDLLIEKIQKYLD